MKVSELIKILEDIKKFHGDQFIWSLEDMDFPCPRSFEVELTKTLKKSDGGYTGGKAGQETRLLIGVEYDGVKVEDRCIEEM